MTKILDFSKVNEKQQRKKISCAYFINWKKKYFNLHTHNAKYTHKVPRSARKQTTTLTIPKVLVIAK